MHLVDKSGEKIIVEMKEYNSTINNINEMTNDIPQIDIEWYLSHGYKMAEDVWREIENGNNQ